MRLSVLFNISEPYKLLLVLLPAFLRTLVLVDCILGVRGQFFLPDHPFYPHDSSSGSTLQRESQRSPCPGLNTLANHGYINRNGSDISIRDVAESAEIVFGFAKSETVRIGVSMLLMGIPTTSSSKLSSNEVHGSIRFNLFDLYTHNAGEHDASLVREDHYFDKFAQFNLTLFEQLIAPSVNGTLTFDNIFDHMKKRIINSRTQNPGASFDHHPYLAHQIGANALALAAVSDDPELKVVRTDFL